MAVERYFYRAIVVSVWHYMYTCGPVEFTVPVAV